MAILHTENNRTRKPRQGIINTIPFLLILGTVASFIGYFQILGVSTGTALELAGKRQWTYVDKDKTSEFKTGSDVLKHWDDRPIPHSAWLELLYLGIFLSAECAFVLMALREYINDTRHVSELEWMFGKQDAQALKNMQNSIQARLQDEAALKSGTTPQKQLINGKESHMEGRAYTDVSPK